MNPFLEAFRQASACQNDSFNQMGDRNDGFLPLRGPDTAAEPAPV